MSRVLISVRRHVENDQAGRYDTAWSHFRDAAVSKGAKAWRFHSGEEDALYLEFLEFKVEADPRQDAEMVRALADLELISSGAAEEWLDANIQ